MFFAESIVPQHPLVSVVQDAGELAFWEKLLLGCAAAGFIAWDTETSGFDWWGSSSKYREGGARIIGHCFGYDLHDGHGPRGVYFPIRHLTIDRQLPADEVTAMVQRILGNPRHQIATQFGKYDWHMAEVDGIDVQATLHQVNFMAHLLDENQEFKLEKLIENHNLDPNPRLFESVVKQEWNAACKRYGAKKDHKKHGYFNVCPGYAWVPVPVLGPYGAWDGRLTLLGAYEFFPKIQEHYWDLYGVEMAVFKSIQGAEHRGVPLDIPYLEHATHRLESEGEQLKEKIQELAGYRVEPGKDAQVRELLYERLRIPVEHYTDAVKYDHYGQEIRTPSVDVVALSYIKHSISSPIVEKLLEYRTVTKLVSSFTRPLADACDSSGRVHANMNQLGTVSGRFSVKDPALQTIPTENKKHPERSVRRAFLVPQGKVRLILDWSQIELRVLAVEAQEPAMLAAFKAGVDLHAGTSMDMFGNKLDSNRTVAKRINFGISYGLSPIGLMHQLNKEADPDNGIPFVTEEEAKGWFNKWLSKYTRVPKYMDELVKRALCHSPPQYTNEFGRTRRVEELRALGRAGKRGARMLVASRIQGGASEFTKVSIVRCQQIIDWARETGRWEADLCLTIHDELQFDCDAHGAVEAVTMFKAAMEDFPQLSAPADGRIGVPVVCDAEWTATNWSEKVSVWPDDS
jgi:DNA polymerase-1